VLLQVEGDGHDPVGKLEELARHAALQAVDAGDAVAHREHGAHLRHVHPGGEAPELLLDDPGDLPRANLHGDCYRPPTLAALAAPDQAFAQGLQPAAHGAVVRLASHADEQAAEDLGGLPSGELHPAAGGFLEGTGQGVPLRLGEGHRGDRLRRDHPPVLVPQLAIGLADAGEESQAVARHEEVDQPLEERPRAGLLPERGQDLPLPVHPDRGVLEDSRELGVAEEEVPHSHKLLPEALRVALVLEDDLEEGARVATGEGPGRAPHAAPPRRSRGTAAVDLVRWFSLGASFIALVGPWTGSPRCASGGNLPREQTGSQSWRVSPRGRSVSAPRGRRVRWLGPRAAPPGAPRDSPGERGGGDHPRSAGRRSGRAGPRPPPCATPPAARTAAGWP